jgi:hypothetical protein
MTLSEYLAALDCANPTPEGWVPPERVEWPKGYVPDPIEWVEGCEPDPSETEIEEEDGERLVNLTPGEEDPVWVGVSQMPARRVYATMKPILLLACSQCWRRPLTRARRRRECSRRRVTAARGSPDSDSDEPAEGRHDVALGERVAACGAQAHSRRRCTAREVGVAR